MPIVGELRSNASRGRVKKSFVVSMMAAKNGKPLCSQGKGVVGGGGGTGGSGGMGGRPPDEGGTGGGELSYGGTGVAGGFGPCSSMASPFQRATAACYLPDRRAAIRAFRCVGRPSEVLGDPASPSSGRGLARGRRRDRDPRRRARVSACVQTAAQDARSRAHGGFRGPLRRGARQHATPAASLPHLSGVCAGGLRAARTSDRASRPPGARARRLGAGAAHRQGAADGTGSLAPRGPARRAVLGSGTRAVGAHSCRGPSGPRLRALLRSARRRVGSGRRLSTGRALARRRADARVLRQSGRRVARLVARASCRRRRSPERALTLPERAS